MRFSMILEMIDRFSGPGNRVRGSVKRLTGTARRMGAQMRRTGKDVDGGSRSLRDLARSARRNGLDRFRRMATRAGHSARRLGGRLQRLEKRLNLVGRAGHAAGRGLRGLVGKAASLVKTGIFAGAAAGAFALFDLFRTAGQFEQYEIMLENMMGSAKAGRKAMDWIVKFAKDTPFELDAVTESFIILKNAGIDPMEGSLLAAGDASAGMSKNITQAAEAIADAVMGENERLKELGISASRSGDQIRYSWTKNEKQFEKTADATDKVAVALAVAEAWNHKFSGSMAKQSKSLFGIISNLKDLWSNFMVMVAEAGIFDVIKKDLDGVRANVERMAKDGSLKKWAEEISDRLEQAYNWAKDFIENTDWKGLLADLKSLADAALIVANAVKVVAENWSMVSRAGRLTVSPTAPAKRIYNTGEAIYKHFFGADASATTRQNRFSPSSQPPRARAANDVNVGGRVEIDVRAAGGLAARTRRVDNRGSAVPIEARTGRAMRGAA